MDVRVWLWIPARKGTTAQCCWVLLVFFPRAPVWRGWTSCCDSANISVVDCLHCLQSLKVFSSSERSKYGIYTYDFQRVIQFLHNTNKDDLYTRRRR